MRFFLIISVFCLSVSFSHAQVRDTLNILEGVKVDNEIIPHQEMQTIYIYPRKEFKSKRYEDQYWRLVNKVKKVYPYAKRAGELLKEYNVRFMATNDKKLQRQYVRKAEEELFKQYGDQLKKLTISEGRILIKLIDRQTGSTSYELIKELKGGLAVFFWQGVARIFGNDLKSQYDPATEDRLIEEIIYYIELGIIV